MQVCNLLTSSGLKSEVHFLNSHKSTENAGSFPRDTGCLAAVAREDTQKAVMNGLTQYLRIDSI